MTAAAPRAVRPEIQALRALAVAAVVLNHLWPRFVGGGFVGVDIFFVISGYLITNHLWREVQANGTISLGRFWARRARRLLPASLLVLLVSAIAALVLLPQNLWQIVMRQIAASALYVLNWFLAADAQDYFASANSPSPVTHYWSLSVEEQFYVVWPLLMLALVWLAGRRRSPSARRVTIVGLAVVFSGSLAYSVVATAVTPAAAYFVTPTRAWEFAAGGLLALIPLAARVPPALLAVVAWGGWAVMGASVLLIDETMPFPGALALVPVIGCLAVIWAGTTRSGFGPDRLVGLPPFQRLGDISYSLYLWHWPLIVLVPYATASELGTLDKVAVLAASLVLAYCSKRWVEDPLRSATPLLPPLRTLVATVAAMAIVVGISGATLRVVDDRYEAVLDELTLAIEQDDQCIGALALTSAADCSNPFDLAYPDSVLLASSRLPNLTESGAACQQERDSPVLLACSFGVPLEEATARVALVGDSHAAHWTSAIDAIAVERGWHVTMMTKSSCAVSLNPLLQAEWYPAGADSCREWAADVVSTVANDPDIDMVITSSISREYVSTDGDPENRLAEQVDGYRAAWNVWTAAGKTVVVLGDVPRMFLGDIPTCVAIARALDDPCAVERSIALPVDPLLLAAGDTGDPLIVPIDSSEIFCDERLCHSVVGGMVAYGDASHITSIFARTAAPFLLSKIGDARGGN